MTFQMNAGAVRRFAKAMRFGAWLQSITDRMTPAPFRLVQIGSAYWQSKALYVAAKLDLATALGTATLTASALASRVDANEDALGRLMRLLAAMGIFEETAPMVFRNNKLSRCLTRDDPKSVRAMILMHNSETMSRPWFEQLEAGIRSGTPPFQLSHGEDLFDYLDHHAEFDQLFSEAMNSVEALAGDGFATDLDWGRFDRIIDVGGSRGTKSLAILRRHPRLAALIVDRPQVIEEARRYWAEHHADGLERLQFQAANLFESLPAAGPKDVYLYSAVLHGFDDPACVQALLRLREAIGNSGARAAILEIVVPEKNADISSASFDMQMFVGSRGRERTLTEWKAIIQAGGLALEEVVRLRSLGSILVLRAG
ncbi:methyltransferase [Cupriavidus metallidurans]|uniref:methyltransferase n=1 Tax=Cupriavidus metallidurans TaxID=119219 RepID=UPI001645929B|nr:methyltransferase [Cupriavidus metallidurans]